MRQRNNAVRVARVSRLTAERKSYTQRLRQAREMHLHHLRALGAELGGVEFLLVDAWRW